MNLRLRLGPFPNELDLVRALHTRQEVATPDDHVDVICSTCYIHDEEWPCAVARLIAILDEEIASNPSAGYDSAARPEAPETIVAHGRLYVDADLAEKFVALARPAVPEALDVERLREALCEAIWNNDPTDGYLADPAVVRLLVDAVLTDPNVKWALAAPEAE